MAKNIKGFTLVEIIASIVILAVISATILGHFSHHLNFALRNERRLMAINLARQTMERIYWDPFVSQAAGMFETIPAGSMGGAIDPVRTFSVNNDNNDYSVVETAVRWE